MKKNVERMLLIALALGVFGPLTRVAHASPGAGAFETNTNDSKKTGKAYVKHQKKMQKQFNKDAKKGQKEIKKQHEA